MPTLAAGESFSGECPSGQKANVTRGEKLPNAEKAQVKVLKVEGGKFSLGPVKAGEIMINVPCEDSIQEIHFTVTELAPEAAMNRFRPLGVEKVEYPNTLYLLILFVLCLPLLASLLFIFRKKKILAKAPLPKSPKNPRMEMEKELSFMEANVGIPESHHFHQLYKALRRFLEKETLLKTRSLTTREFLGTFRALALTQSTNQSLISQLEYVLLTADEVRFTGKSITPELWKDYLQKVRAIVAAFPPKVETNNKSPKVETTNKSPKVETPPKSRKEKA